MRRLGWMVLLLSVACGPVVTVPDAGSGGGATSGGVTAGGSVSGGSAGGASGGTSGGSTSGGASGGGTAGGATSGGSTSGGASGGGTAGGATNGGSTSGGASGGGTAGGGTAGGGATSGGASGGGSTSGGASGGGTAGGGSTSGGASGGGTAGGATNGGSTSGGASGGGTAGGGSTSGGASGGGTSGGATSGGSTSGGAGGGSALNCPSLSTATTQQQVAIVTGTTSCALTFVTLLVQTPAQYRDAFLTLISSSATEALFFATYDEARLERFRFDAVMVDFWYANLPGAVAACTGTRCADWTSFILARLYDGRMYRCPSLTGLSAPALLAIVPYGDFYCTDSIATALAPIATTPTITSLLSTLTTHARPWSRRNAIRIIGRFGERPSGDPARTLAVTTNATAVTQATHQCLMVDTDTNVLNDCIWVLDSFFYPFLPMQPALEAIAMGNTYDTTTRFRAAAAISRLINSKAGLLSAGDQAYLTSALGASDEWVRAQAAFTIETMPAAKLNPSIQSALSTALTNAYAVEQILNPKVFMARALDRLNGTSLTAQLRTTFEAQHLGSTASANGFTIRSGLDAGVLPSFLSFMTSEVAAFHDILGPTFATPVPNDPNPGMTLLLFATRARYQEYMDAFVGFGSQAGGLYLEGIGTLYTYERTPAQSIYTVRELIQHEFGHYLQGRFVYPGLWTDPGYHTQPKGWADEGFAEVLGGLSFDGGSYFIHGRPQHVSAICQVTPFTTIDALTTRRTGYDQAGTFDYTNSWGLNFWLFTSERPRGRALFSALRSGTYTQSTWASVAGYPSTSAAQTAWYTVLGNWCTNGGPPGPSGAPSPSIPPFLVPFVPINESVCREVERLPELPASRPPRGPPTQ